MKTICHTTCNARNRIATGGSIVNVRNRSSTIELMMGAREANILERRFFIDIGEIIPDDLMGRLLLHFVGQGLLLDEEGNRI